MESLVDWREGAKGHLPTFREVSLTIDECMWGGNNNITEILKGRRYGGHGRVG